MNADLYSFLPFGESTIDVLHTRWAYHSGFPRATLFECQRVLRPGGWLIIRQMSNHPVSHGTLDRVVQVGAALGWRRAHHADANLTLGDAPNLKAHCGDKLEIFQMPVPVDWPEEAQIPHHG